MPLTIQNFRGSISNKIYSRGLSYWKDGRVTSCRWQPNAWRWEAKVEGSHKKPYRVYIETIQRNSITNCECSCPFSSQWEGWCKHIAAALFEIQEQMAEADRQNKAQLLSTSLKESDTSSDGEAEIVSESELHKFLHSLTDSKGESKKYPQKKTFQGKKVELPKPDFPTIVREASRESLIDLVLQYGFKNKAFRSKAEDYLVEEAKSVGATYQTHKQNLDTALKTGELQRYANVVEAVLEQAVESRAEGSEDACYGALLAIIEGLQRVAASKTWASEHKDGAVLPPNLEQLRLKASELLG